LSYASAKRPSAWSASPSSPMPLAISFGSASGAPASPCAGAREARSITSIAARSAQWQATQAGQAQNQPTVTGMAPSWGAPAIYASPSEPRPAQSGLAQSGPRPTGPGDSGPVQTRRMRRRPNTWVIALVLGVAVVAAIVAFIAIPGGHPASSASSSSAPASASAATGSRHNASPKPSNSPGASAAGKVLLTDDFSTNKAGWVDDAHASAGAYTGSGAYRLSVTGYNGQNELARPSSAGSGPTTNPRPASRRRRSRPRSCRSATPT